jgi:hypothetical protein
MSQILFPLELKIERNDAPESFSMPDDGSILSVQPTTPRYHVTAVLLDVERRRTVSYEFWSMVDPSRGPYEDVGRITHVPTSAQVGSLRALRDALDEVLPPREAARGLDADTTATLESVLKQLEPVRQVVELTNDAAERQRRGEQVHGLMATAQERSAADAYEQLNSLLASYGWIPPEEAEEER